MKRLVILLTALLLLSTLAGCSAPREYPTSFTGKDGTVVKVLPLEAAETENEGQASYAPPDWASLLGVGTDLVVKAKITSIKLLELPSEAIDKHMIICPRIEVEIIDKLYGSYARKNVSFCTNLSYIPIQEKGAEYYLFLHLYDESDHKLFAKAKQYNYADGYSTNSYAIMPVIDGEVIIPDLMSDISEPFNEKFGSQQFKGWPWSQRCDEYAFLERINERIALYKSDELIKHCVFYRTDYSSSGLSLLHTVTSRDIQYIAAPPVAFDIEKAFGENCDQIVKTGAVEVRSVTAYGYEYKGEYILVNEKVTLNDKSNVFAYGSYANTHGKSGWEIFYDGMADKAVDGLYLGSDLYLRQNSWRKWDDGFNLVEDERVTGYYAIVDRFDSNDKAEFDEYFKRFAASQTGLTETPRFISDNASYINDSRYDLFPIMDDIVYFHSAWPIDGAIKYEGERLPFAEEKMMEHVSYCDEATFLKSFIPLIEKYKNVKLDVATPTDIAIATATDAE